MDTRRLLRTPAVALAAAALFLSGCSSSDPDTGAGPGPGSNPGAAAVDQAALAKYYDQKLNWHACGASGFQCATMKAPLDYTKPNGTQIKLAVARKKATGPGKRLGSLLVNPGGPGGSAIQYLESYAGIGYPAQVRARYDMAAMDPRGVAGSEPVDCLTGKQMDAYTEVDQTPDDAAEVKDLTAAFKKFAQGCEAHSAKLLPHVSTVDAARDMDLFRAVLGDKKLSYVGASYGTFLGATYAGLFPKNTGRIVLDGAMDPSLSARQLNEQQTAGFETAFESFARDCVSGKQCPLGTKSVQDVEHRLHQFFDRLDRKPLPTGQSRELTESLATTGVIAALYDESAWPRLRQALRSALTGDGELLLALADSYYERDTDGHYSNLMYANAAVNCLDLPPAFTGPKQVEAALPSFEKASPVFGDGLAWASLSCTYWPTKATGTAHRIEAKGAAPIVVVGTTRDPATPYKWARSLASQLDSGRLLTYEGDGHTAYGRGSDCIDTAINTYLLDGTPPAKGKKCT
ncbi:alpha/beta hydrolase [Streptomyces montanisoli]|uniref:Alpha/beta fold hydrolase n=1 Tax=Streptomyces montanisoli TaxID=2798581 RepID=A0A940M9Q5_9ACTN|nr:alpha/beta hydrolase [Streptomyces montanisoli]MBP0456491.1 alpha/beta fold hydrolase [Streptomyces montanisoli]